MPDTMRSPLPEKSALAVRAWNLMGGEIKWEGIELISTILGIRDIEMLIEQLAVIRNVMSED